MAIDRGKLKNDIRNYFDRIIELAKEDSPDIVFILESARNGVMKIIGNQIPVTAGCKPRYAEWDGDYRCTNCGISLRDLVAEDSELDTDIILYGTPFCPNCGADMTHGKRKE